MSNRQSADIYIYKDSIFSFLFERGRTKRIGRENRRLAANNVDES